VSRLAGSRESLVAVEAKPERKINMSSVEMQSLLEAGMHFGHLTRRWNPKMRPFIYGVRNGIHIIDLSKTAKLFKSALDNILEHVGNGADVLFVGTKKQAQDIIRDEALRCNMFYVNQRWLGGTLTNWRTIKASIDRLKGLQKKKDEGVFDDLRKKEKLMIDREIEKYLHSLGGIQNMNKVPGLIVLIDPHLEHIALHEANVLGIPVVALADTNCDPDPIDFLVPGNDDALRSIKLFLSIVADNVLEGLQLREERSRRAAEERKSKEAEKAEVREVEVGGKAGATYVADRKPDEASQEESAEGQYSAKVEAAGGAEPVAAEASSEEAEEKPVPEKTEEQASDQPPETPKE
jgi:small subunit ribosomal protein S2